jgi:glycosyltransferase involved in cell wall biosynthesis
MNNLNVVFISNWFGNPYKELLIKHLSRQQIQVAEQLRQLLFVFQISALPDVRIVHLQTLHYFFVSRNPVYFWSKFLIFIGQLYLLKLFGIRVIWTVHEWKDKNSGGQHDLSPLKAKLLGQALDGVITHCESTRQEMTQALGLSQNSKKVFVIPHGNYINYYENSISPAEARSSLNIPAGNTVFLLFGGIHPNKGVLEAISAFKQLDTASTSLIIAGHPNSSQLRAEILSEVSCQPNILFVDPSDKIPDSEVQRYMNACDVVLLPYKVFTTSGVALLAMSFGRACIAPEAGFFSDVFDQTSAFLYPPQSDQALALALQTAIDQKDKLTQMGQRSRALAEAANWDVIAEKTAWLYRWALGESVGAQP